MQKLPMALLMILLTSPVINAEDLGNLSANPFDFESSSNAFGKEESVRAQRHQQSVQSLRQPIQ